MTTVDQNQHNLNKKQKIAAAVLAVFALLILILWSVQFKRSLSGPLGAPSGNQNTQDNVNPAPGEQSEEALRSKDTDKDGLSDWDELNFYFTSPYLEDSDSDGFPDKEEIDNDKDPNCPAGRDCYSSGIVDGNRSIVSGKLSGETGQSGDTINEILKQLGYGEGTQSSDDSVSALSSLFESGLDAAGLRQLLIEYGGMDKEVLDQIPDNVLINSFNEILNEK